MKADGSCTATFGTAANLLKEGKCEDVLARLSWEHYGTE
jgi:hypothetical protein